MLKILKNLKYVEPDMMQVHYGAYLGWCALGFVQYTLSYVDADLEGARNWSIIIMIFGLVAGMIVELIRQYKIHKNTGS